MLLNLLFSLCCVPNSLPLYQIAPLLFIFFFSIDCLFSPLLVFISSIISSSISNCSSLFSVSFSSLFLLYFYFGVSLLCFFSFLLSVCSFLFCLFSFFSFPLSYCPFSNPSSPCFLFLYLPSYCPTFISYLLCSLFIILSQFLFRVDPFFPFSFTSSLFFFFCFLFHSSISSFFHFFSLV